MLAFTIIAGNYAAMARHLAESFRKHHSGARFAVVVVDRTESTCADLGEVAEVVSLQDIDFGAEGWGRMAVSYDIGEFATAVKPFAARHFLRRGEDKVLYFDADIEVHSPLDLIVDALDSSSIVLTPHSAEPMVRDGLLLNEFDLLRCGAYNAGFFGVSRRAEPFLDWWSERLRRDGIVDRDRSLFADQKWLDLAVPIFEPHIERSPIMNVAYWNVDQRPMSCHGGRYWVGSEPLGFVHFSGFDPVAPWALSKYSGAFPRALLSADDVLAALVKEYCDALLRLGHVARVGQEYGLSMIAPDIVLTQRLRRHYRSQCVRADAGEQDLPPDPFSEDGYESFVDWLRDPIAGEPTGLPRYHWLIFANEPGLSAQLPQTYRGHHDEFYRWLWEDYPRRDELSLIVETPLPPRRALAAEVPVRIEQIPGVRVSGQVDGDRSFLPLAELVLDALRQENVECAADPLLGPRPDARRRHADPNRFSVNLIVADGFAMPALTSSGVRRQFTERYTVLYWPADADLPSIPAGFALNDIDEIWVPNARQRAHISRFVANPIYVVSLPFQSPSEPRVQPVARHMPSRFTFLGLVDNPTQPGLEDPVSTIMAYSGAFKVDEPTRLVVSVADGANHRDLLEQLRYASRRRGDIEIRSHTGLDRAALLRTADALVTLHRDEAGAGALVDAMSIGLPCVTTRSPVELVDGTTAFPLIARSGSYVDSATRTMRDLYTAGSECSAVGDRGRVRVELVASERRKRMKERLEVIWKELHGA